VGRGGAVNVRAEEPIANGSLIRAEARSGRCQGDKKSRRGSGNADMIQDLAALTELVKKYLKKLKAIDIDKPLFESASLKADSPGKLYARAFIEKSTAVARDLRDRAFTYIQVVMAEMPDEAEYALPNNNNIGTNYSGDGHEKTGKTPARPQ
jgi:hypothetical protein